MFPKTYTLTFHDQLLRKKEGIFHGFLNACKLISKPCTFNHVLLMNCCCQFSSHKHTSEATWRVVIPETESVIPQGVSNYFQVGVEGVMKFSEKTNSNSLQFAKLQSTNTLIKKDISENQVSHSGGTANGKTNKQKSLE